MPSWGVHIAMANELLKKFESKRPITKEEKNEFLLGNILPDIKNGYIIDGKTLSSFEPHTKTHFVDADILDPAEKFSSLGYRKFVQKYKNDLNNFVVLGYLTHLMTDVFWNKQTIRNHFIYDDNNEVIGARLVDNEEIECNLKEARVFKHKDFRYYGYYCSKKYDPDIPEFTEGIIKGSQIIEEVNPTAEDLEVTINFIAKTKTIIEAPEYDKYKDYKFKMFSEEEMKKIYDDCIEYVYNYFDTITKYIDVV